MEPKGSKGQSARIEELEIRLRSLEGGSGSARGRAGGFMERIVPPEATRHFKAAGREQLLGMRALVDHWIKRMGDDDQRRPAGREDIPIE
jgi:hypothetical protein